MVLRYHSGDLSSSRTITRTGGAHLRDLPLHPVISSRIGGSCRSLAVGKRVQMGATVIVENRALSKGRHCLASNSHLTRSIAFSLSPSAGATEVFHWSTSLCRRAISMLPMLTLRPLHLRISYTRTNSLNNSDPFLVCPSLQGADMPLALRAGLVILYNSFHPQGFITFHFSQHTLRITIHS